MVVMEQNVNILNGQHKHDKATDKSECTGR